MRKRKAHRGERVSRLFVQEYKKATYSFFLLFGGKLLFFDNFCSSNMMGRHRET